MRKLTPECSRLLLQIVKRLGAMLYPQMTDDEWEESKHKRDKNGRFASMGGAKTSGSSEPPTGKVANSQSVKQSSLPKTHKEVTGEDIAKSEKAQKVRRSFEKFGGTKYQVVPPGVNDVVQTVRKYGPNEKRVPGATVKIPENANPDEFEIYVLPEPKDNFNYSDESPSSILSGGRIVLSSLRGRDRLEDRRIANSIVQNEVAILGGLREDGVYYRVTDNPKEEEYLKNGTIRASVNHRTGEKEDGLSCWEIPKYIGKHLYRISGEIVGVGSDGEPVLDPKTVKLLPPISSKKLGEMRTRGEEAFCKLYGWTSAQLKKVLSYW